MRILLSIQRAVQVKFVTISPKLEIDTVPATFVDTSTIGTF